MSALPHIPDINAERNAAVQTIYSLCRQHNLHIAIVATRNRRPDGTWDNEPAVATAFGGADDSGPDSGALLHTMGAMVGAAMRYQTILLDAMAQSVPPQHRDDFMRDATESCDRIAAQYAGGKSPNRYERVTRTDTRRSGGDRP